MINTLLVLLYHKESFVSIRFRFDILFIRIYYISIIYYLYTCIINVCVCVYIYIYIHTVCIINRLYKLCNKVYIIIIILELFIYYYSIY